jgi:hypothetical protein
MELRPEELHEVCLRFMLRRGGKQGFGRSHKILLMFPMGMSFLQITAQFILVTAAGSLHAAGCGMR